MKNELVEKVVNAIDVDDHPYFTRRAMDKDCIEVIFDQHWPGDTIYDDSFICVDKLPTYKEAEKRMNTLVGLFRAKAVLNALDDAGFVVVPVEPTEAIQTKD